MRQEREARQQEKITVMGGGNGGFAAAADLTLRGHQVTLYEVPAFSAGLAEVLEKGGIELETHPSNGLKSGFSKLHKITTDIEEALDESEIILIIAPSFSLRTMAELCAPYLKEHHVVVLCPGNFGGSIFFHRVLMEKGCRFQIAIAELACMMYATRKKTPSSSWVRGFKHNLGFSVFPSEKCDAIFQRISMIYPNITKYNNVLETGLSNINTCMHTSLMLFNLTNIDNRYEQHFYRECFTPSVQNMLNVLDQERLGFNRFPFIKLLSLNEIVKQWYEYQGARGQLVQELMVSNPIFAFSMLPTSLEHRYITEDVPYGLIPIEALMEQLGLEHQAHTALIRVLCSVCGKDFYAGARSLKDLGINGLSSSELKQYLMYGPR